MIVKDIVQLLSDFDENMEVGIKSTCGMLNLVVSVKRHIDSIMGNDDFVIIQGVPSSLYPKNYKNSVMKPNSVVILDKNFRFSLVNISQLEQI